MTRIGTGRVDQKAVDLCEVIFKIYQWKHGLDNKIHLFRYCLHHGGYQLFESRQEASYNGEYFQTFNNPGIYYFQTQSNNIERAFCVVQVVEKARCVQILFCLIDQYGKVFQ